MNLTIKNLTKEQYNKVMNFAKETIKEQYNLRIFRDTDGCPDWQTEIQNIFDKDKIKDTIIFNNLKDYTLCDELERDYNPEEIEQLKKDGYYCFYIESYIHGGISLYEYNGALKDKWDCGIGGVVAIKGDFKVAYESFKEFLKFWQKVNDGDFYGFYIENQFGDTIDSCGGFWSIEEIKEYLPDYITDEQFKKAVENIEY